MPEKETKQTITKDMIPEGFTLSLALADAIPVLLFAVAIMLLGIKASFSPLIIAGGVIAFLGGAIKVLWKIIVALKHKNIFWMYQQMPPVMSVGFLVLIIGCIVSRHDIAHAFSSIGPASIVFFALWAFGMSLMSLFAAKLDHTKPQSNWVEQITNGVSQLFLCIGLALL